MRHRRLLLLFALALLTTATKCDEGDSTLEHVNPPDFEVSGVSISGRRTIPSNTVSSAIAITNGTTEQVTVTVNIRRKSGFEEAVTESVSIFGEGMNLETRNVTIPRGVNSGSENFSLSCNEGGSPAGTVGNVHGASGTNTRKGSRECKTSPAVQCGTAAPPLGCLPPPSPCSDCGGFGQPLCSPRCGQPYTPCQGPPGCGNALTACTDNPLVLTANAKGVESAAVYLLCIPSVGPTQGTL